MTIFFFKSSFNQKAGKDKIGRTHAHSQKEELLTGKKKLPSIAPAEQEIAGKIHKEKS